MAIISWIVSGLFVGLLAQFVIRGPHNLGCAGTVVLGIIGSLVGGAVINALQGDGIEFAAAGFWGSLLGAMIILVLARLLRPAPPPATRGQDRHKA